MRLTSFATLKPRILFALGGSAAVAALTMGAATVGCGSASATPEARESESALQGDAALDGSDLPDHVLSLTFDDGPGTNTVALAEYLRGQGIHATFFVIGSTAVGKEDVLAKLTSMGHLVANHTFTHPVITESSDPVSEVGKTDAVIAPFVTDNMFFFRAPQGIWDSDVEAKLNRAGLGRYVGHVHWTAGGTFSNRTSMDWNCWQTGTSIEACGRGYINEITKVGRGAILMHDVHDTTYDLVRWLVPRLRARGFAFARLDASRAIASASRNAGGRPSAVAPTAPRPTPPRAAFEATPFDLSFLAFRGELKGEGIPTGGSLCEAVSTRSVDAAIVADAALYSGHISPADAADGSYLNALEMQLEHLCD